MKSNEKPVFDGNERTETQSPDLDQRYNPIPVNNADRARILRKPSAREAILKESLQKSNNVVPFEGNNKRAVAEEPRGMGDVFEYKNSVDYVKPEEEKPSLVRRLRGLFG